jgi:hypothetical protein
MRSLSVKVRTLNIKLTLTLGNRGKGLSLLHAGTKKRKKPSPRDKIPLTTSLNNVAPESVPYWQIPGLSSPKNVKRFHFNEQPSVFGPGTTPQTSTSLRYVNK